MDPQDSADLIAATCSHLLMWDHS